MRKALLFALICASFCAAQQNTPVDSFVPTIYRYHGPPPASINCLRYQVGFDDVANNIYTCSTAGVWTLTAGSGGGSMTWPASPGIAVYGGSNAWGASLAAPAGTIVGTTDVQSLSNKNFTGAGNTFPTFNQSTTGSAATATALASLPTNCGAGSAAIGILANGNATGCFTPSGAGTVTQVTSGNFSPLFTVGVATNTSTPAFTFTASTAAANTVFGNFTGAPAAPTFTAAPTFSAANLTNFPTFNQSTSGNAATSTALASTPTNCGAGVAAIGILANGNATGCFTPSGSGTVASGTINGMAYYTGATTVGSTTPPTVNGLYFGVENVVASASVAPTHQLMGIPVVTPTTPYTMLYSDRATYQRLTGGSTFTFNLGQITSNFASNMPFVIQNGNSGLLTLTANAADKIDNSALGGTSTVLSNFASFVYQDSSSAPGNWWTLKVPTFAAFGTTCTNGLNWSTTTGIGCQATAPGTVTSVATTSPITGGTFTTTGTIACATCTTSAASLTLNELLFGAGSQGMAVGDLTGDVTTAGGKATTIAANAVTLAKMATQANATLLSNVSGGVAVPSANALPTTANALIKTSNANGALAASLTTDDGTTSTYTGTGGTKSPVFTSTGTTAGFHDYPQGTTSAAVAPCNVATSICEQAPAAVTSYLVTKPGAAGTGVRIGVNASSVVTENFSSAFGAVSQTAKTAAVTTFTVCAATANTACGQAGQYRLTYNVWGSGTACATVTAGSVVLNFTWTDENAVTHTTINAPMWDQKTAAMTSGQTNFNTALGTEGGSGSFIVSTNGTIIQAATTYTACTSGTGTYNVRITTEQLQ